jgi:hypothetical protein
MGPSSEPLRDYSCCFSAAEGSISEPSNARGNAFPPELLTEIMPRGKCFSGIHVRV